MKIPQPKATRTWKTSDGQNWEDQKTAQTHEIIIKMRSEIIALLPAIGDRRLSPADMANMMAEKHEVFIPLLQAYKQKKR